MGLSTESSEHEVDLHDAEMSTMTTAPVVAAVNGSDTARFARNVTAVAYGLFALQQPGTLQQLAEVAGTVQATGRVSASRASGQVVANDPQIEPSRAATPANVDTTVQPTRSADRGTEPHTDSPGPSRTAGPVIEPETTTPKRAASTTAPHR